MSTVVVFNLLEIVESRPACGFLNAVHSEVSEGSALPGAAWVKLGLHGRKR